MLSKRRWQQAPVEPVCVNGVKHRHMTLVQRGPPIDMADVDNAGALPASHKKARALETPSDVKHT